jgi:hypothetical protein
MPLQGYVAVRPAPPVPKLQRHAGAIRNQRGRSALARCPHDSDHGCGRELKAVLRNHGGGPGFGGHVNAYGEPAFQDKLWAVSVAPTGSRPSAASSRSQTGWFSAPLRQHRAARAVKQPHVDVVPVRSAPPQVVVSLPAWSCSVSAFDGARGDQCASPTIASAQATRGPLRARHAVCRWTRVAMAGSARAWFRSAPTRSTATVTAARSAVGSIVATSSKVRRPRSVTALPVVERSLSALSRGDHLRCARYPTDCPPPITAPPHV